MEITVVIPAYNAGHTLGRALSSIASQTQLPQAVIVVDDGSTDDTVAVVARHGIHQRVPTRVISRRNAGVSAARNVGIREASTSHIALLDADDAFHPDHLALKHEAHRACPQAVVYWSGIERVFDNDSLACQVEAASLPDFNALSMKHTSAHLVGPHHLVGPTVFDDLIQGNFICLAVFQRRVQGQLQLFNEQIRFSEDRLFYLELLGLGPGVFTNQPTLYIHRDGLNTSVTTDRRKSLAHNQQKLASMACARSIPSISQHRHRRERLEHCIHQALDEQIYYASFAGMGDTLRAIQQAYGQRSFKCLSRPLFLARNLVRATLHSLPPRSVKPAGRS
jgi:glycosyltransferase involved in cell wall biosynthesis